MRTVGFILLTVVGGLVLYVIWSLFTGDNAMASTGTAANTLNRTAGSNAKTGGGTFVKWNPSNASATSTGIVGAVEKITGAKVLGFSDTKNTWSDGRIRTS